MISAPLLANEELRLAALARYRVLDTPADAAFDDLTALAAQICGVPIATISLVDREREWFKSRIGIAECELGRASAFCSHTILEPDHLVVPDALADPRFAETPSVIGRPFIRFYAGVPLRTAAGLALGALCVKDYRPRELDAVQLNALKALGRQVMSQLELRITAFELSESVARHVTMQQQWDTLRSQLPAGVFECDSNGRCTYVNERWCEQAGMSLAQALGEGWVSSVHPGDYPQVRTDWENAVTHHQEFVSQWRFLQPSGEVRWVEGRARVQRDANGVVGYIGTTTDITTVREAALVARRHAEEIQVGKRGLEALLSAAPLGIVTYTPEGIVVSWSTALESMFGWSAAEAIGRFLPIAAPSEQARFRQDTLLRHAGGGLKVEYESIRWHKDGTPHNVVISAAIIQRVDGAPAIFCAMYTDIGERVQRELAMQQTNLELDAMVTELGRTNAELDALITASPLGICMVDRDQRIATWNTACERMFGYRSAEIVGQNLRLLRTQEDASHQVTIARLLDQGGTAEYEATRIRKDGTAITVIVSLAALRNPEHEDDRIVVVYTDISERQRARDLLERQSFVLSQSIRNAPVAMAMFDTEMRYVAWSQQWLVDYNLLDSNLMGRSHYEVFPNLPDRWKQLHERALRGEILSESEDRFEQADGSTTFLRWAIHPWAQMDGGIGGVVMVTAVVTDLVRARHEALESSRLKSEFLASMSHEIRTPMNGVLGMAGLLLDSGLTGDQREYAELILSSADSLLTIINDILDFSKIEAGRLEIEPIAFELPRLIYEVVELLAPRVTEKQLELAVRLAADVPRQVTGDPGRVRQILTNLIGNAVKFTERGQVEITAGSTPEGHLRFEIKDTGIGIPVSKLGQIFDKFTQADASTTRKFGGTGLGLAICRELVRLMGGEIGVTSAPGEGSCFWFTLPLPVAGTPIAPMPSVLSADTTILVIDDVAVTREVLTEQLTRLGGSPVSAADLPGALALIRQLPPGVAIDAILLDAGLQQQDGPDFRALLHREPAAARSPVLLLSSRSQRRGANDLSLRKPVRLEDLTSALLVALRGTLPNPDAIPLIENQVQEDTTIPDLTQTQKAIRILVVEDNPVNQKVAARMLGNLGCRVDLAANGAEAVDLLSRLPYDMVFMDCMMPEMDGYDATAAIRRLPGPRSRIPIVAMTANAMLGDRARCLAAGMDDYVSKPVRSERLKAAVERWAKRPTREKAPSLSTSTASTVIATSGTPVDLDALNQLGGLQSSSGADIIVEFIEIFLTDLPTRRSDLQSAVASGIAATIVSAAHALNGSSAYMGARDLHRLCAELESAGRAQDIPRARQIATALDLEAAAVHAFLLDHIASRPTEKAG